jgi:histidine phosphotransferase ChpT
MGRQMLRDDDDDMRLGELMCSRLCHDLVGPAGALMNGIEILGATGAVIDAEILDLLAEGGRRLNHQLAFFRMAFGLRGGIETTSTLEEARSLATALLDGGRVTVDWPPDASGPGDDSVLVPAAAVRLVMNLVMVAADALPRGGRVQVDVGGGGAVATVDVSAVGVGARLAPALIEALGPETTVEQITARTVHAYLAARLAGRLGSTLGAVASPDRIRLTIAVPRLA